MTDSLLGRTDLVTTAVIEGKTELMLSAKGLAYLTGRTEEEVEAEFRRQQAETGRNSVKILKSWYIGAQELQAKYGTDDWVELLELVIKEREGANR